MAGAYGRRCGIAVSFGSLRSLGFAPGSRLARLCSRPEERVRSFAHPAQRRTSLAQHGGARFSDARSRTLSPCQISSLSMSRGLLRSVSSPTQMILSSARRQLLLAGLIKERPWSTPW